MYDKEASQRYYQKHKEELKEKAKIKKENNKEYYNEKSKEYYSRNKERIKLRKINLKRQIIDHYGGKCQCCGENEYDFLAIDHIFGNGNKIRKQTNLIGDRFYRWVVKNNYPKDLQILCHNCNMSKHFNKGKCIHQIKREDDLLWK